MPRPKGSKNKTNLETTKMNEPPREFDYATDDGNFDSNYNLLGPQPVADEPIRGTHLERLPTPVEISSFVSKTPVPEIVNTTFDQRLKLFLVEGDVQLSSRIPGQGVARSKQTRIVWATSDDEALAKFIGYFNTLCNEQHVYAVTGAGATEAIS